MKFKCSLCGRRFDDGQEYAEHIEEVHKDKKTLGVDVAEMIQTDDKFG